MVGEGDRKEMAFELLPECPERLQYLREVEVHSTWMKHILISGYLDDRYQGVYIYNKEL
jgi:hypothetical protein